MFRLLFLVLALWLFVTPALAGDREDILDVERAWNTAAAAKDAAALDRILADDFLLIWADGSVATKAQVLANVRASQAVTDPFKTEEVVVRVYEDTAVVTGRFTQTVRVGGRSATNTFRYTDVYRRAGGTWVGVSAQATLVPQGGRAS